MIKYTNQTTCFVLFALALVMLLPGFNCHVLASPTAGVLDYYLKLPDEYFNRVAADRRARLKYVIVQDVRNGYLKIEKPYEVENLSKLPADEREVGAAENKAARLTAELEIALFKHEQGHNIIAVSYRWSGDCPACAFPRTDFWQDENGELKNVTKAVLAVVDKQMLRAAGTQLGKAGAVAAVSDAEDTDESLTDELVYKLPRTGRTIKIMTDAELTGASVELLNLRWTGTRFVSETIAPRGTQPN